MAFNIGSGEAVNFLKYNAKAGRFYYKDAEIQNPVFLVDFSTLKTGWFYYREGVAPEKVYDPSLSEPALRPEKTYKDASGKDVACFKRGAEVKIFSDTLFNGEADFGSTSLIVLKSLSDLHTAYEEGAKTNQGLFPVVSCKGVTEEKGQYGTNYKPNFVIEKWVPRPASWGGGAQPAKVVPTAPVSSSVSEF